MVDAAFTPRSPFTTVASPVLVIVAMPPKAPKDAAAPKLIGLNVATGALAVLNVHVTPHPSGTPVELVADPWITTV